MISLWPLQEDQATTSTESGQLVLQVRRQQEKATTSTRCRATLLMGTPFLWHCRQQRVNKHSGLLLLQCWCVYMYMCDYMILTVCSPSVTVSMLRDHHHQIQAAHVSLHAPQMPLLSTSIATQIAAQINPHPGHSHNKREETRLWSFGKGHLLFQFYALVAAWFVLVQQVPGLDATQISANHVYQSSNQSKSSGN